MPSYSVISADGISVASPPLAGRVQVGLGPYCDSVELDVTDTAYGIGAKLDSLPGVSSEYCSLNVSIRVLMLMVWTIVCFTLLSQQYYNEAAMRCCYSAAELPASNDRRSPSLRAHC
jgi:hypothetical protein